MTDMTDITAPVDPDALPARPPVFRYPSANTGDSVVSLPPVQVSPAAPASPYAGKTFAQMLISDMPNRISLARAKITAGDIDGGREDLKYVEDFTKAHEGTLTEFTQFQGENLPKGWGY